MYLEFTHSQSFETFVRCHIHAFEQLGGCARELWFDNLATAVAEHEGNLVRFKPRFLAFAREYGFIPRACHVAAGWEKGKVERAIGYVRQNFWPLRSFTDLSHVNSQARRWLEEVANQRKHRETGQPPDRRFQPEFLRPVPLLAPDYRGTVEALVHKDLRLSFDGNRYYVPPRYVGRKLTVKEDNSSVTIYDQSAEITHYARLQFLINLTGPGGDCNYNAELSSDGKHVVSVNSSATLQPGARTLAVNFSGHVIYRSGLNGPFVITDMEVQCGSARGTSRNVYNTEARGPLSATNFENIAGTFTIGPPPRTSVAIAPGKSGSLQLTANYYYGLEAEVSFSASGLPAGITATFLPSTVSSTRPVVVNLSVAPGTATGTYPFTVTGTTGTITRQQALTVEVIPASVTVSISPASKVMYPGETQQFTATVTGHSYQGVQWMLNRNVGTLSATGLYTAPSLVSQQTEVHVAARALADLEQSGYAPVTLFPPSGSVTVTIATSQPGIPFTVSGTNCSAGTYTTPAALKWVPGSSCQVFYTSPALGDQPTVYVFRNWADGPTANPRTFTAPASAATYTANFDPNYRLTLDINPRESGSAGRDGITYVPGTVVNLAAEPNDCYLFQAWSPNAPGGVVTMTEPKTVTVAFALDGAKAVTQVQVTGGTLQYNAGTQRYQQAVTLRNYGGALTSVALVLDNLTGVSGLYQASGSTYCAAPGESAYRDVGTMAAGQTVAFTLEFLGPQSGQFGYTARVLAGSGQR